MSTRFTINTFPEVVQREFNNALMPWEVVFESAMAAGLSDPDMAADLIFYKNHPERMDPMGSGLPLRSGERGYSKLVEEWSGWRGLVEDRFENLQRWNGRAISPAGVALDAVPRIEKMLRGYAKKWSSAAFKKDLKGLTPVERDALVYILTIWPKPYQPNRRLAEMFEIIKTTTGRSLVEESARGRFPLGRGGELMRELIKRGENEPKGKNTCLNFVMKSGLLAISDDERYRQQLQIVGDRYHEVAAYRRAKNQLHKGSLSLLAAEMRLLRMVGPMHYARFNGKRGRRQAYLPDAVDFMESVSPKAGWYFFLCGVVSYHTFFIAERVSKGGRMFKVIEDKGEQPDMSAEELREELNGWHRKGAGTRIWPIYRP